MASLNDGDHYLAEKIVSADAFSDRRRLKRADVFGVGIVRVAPFQESLAPALLGGQITPHFASVALVKPPFGD